MFIEIDKTIASTLKGSHVIFELLMIDNDMPLYNEGNN